MCVVCSVERRRRRIVRRSNTSRLHQATRTRVAFSPEKKEEVVEKLPNNQRQPNNSRATRQQQQQQQIFTTSHQVSKKLREQDDETRGGESKKLNQTHTTTLRSLHYTPPSFPGTTTAHVAHNIATSPFFLSTPNTTVAP